MLLDCSHLSIEGLDVIDHSLTAELQVVAKQHNNATVACRTHGNNTVQTHILPLLEILTFDLLLVDKTAV